MNVRSLISLIATTLGLGGTRFGTKAREEFQQNTTTPAENPYGKSGGGSGKMRRMKRLKHYFGGRRPFFTSHHRKFRQPEGYYTQPIDPRHIHSYGLHHLNRTAAQIALKRPTFQ